MSKAEPPVVRAHEDVALFREAVRFTAAESGFTPRLIEKDYFCTVLLAYLSGGARFRAALSRREPAIRDFYDVDYAVRKGSLRPEADELVSLVKQKLNVPGNDPVDISQQRLAALRRQVEPQLRPVLREQDYTEFDLHRAFKIGVEMARAIELRQ